MGYGFDPVNSITFQLYARTTNPRKYNISIALRSLAHLNNNDATERKNEPINAQKKGVRLGYLVLIFLKLLESKLTQFCIIFGD